LRCAPPALRTEKGSKVYVEGALQTRKWTDNSSQERYTTEVVLQRFRGELTMLDGARAAAGPAGEAGYDEGYAGGGFGDEPTAPGSAAPPRVCTPVNDLDDDIPF
jgi:single-strand DNA-binding protein